MKSPNILRNLPSVSELIESPPLRSLASRVSHNVVVSGVRSFLDEIRDEVQKRAAEVAVPPASELAERIARRILQSEQPTLRPVINATGILLHTGLGRSPLADAAIDELVAVARDYANLEMDLASGQRSDRMRIVSGLLCRLTRAEGALVVNNNAGATVLALAAVAAGREVIVSRGQLVEIGGSYRLPDVMQASGALLREVGTTNKTRVEDYRRAINDNTAAILRVHTSNYRVVGFTEEVAVADLVTVAEEAGVPLIDDIGSGALIDLSEYGLSGEPMAAASLAAGADLVLLSGDKLLGGPQCGILLGRRKIIEQAAAHPLARALRVDKLTLAALAATLRLYRDRDAAIQHIPLLKMLDTPVENLRNRAERLAPLLAQVPAIGSATAVEDIAYLGGGSVPTQAIATWCIALGPSGGNVEQLARRFREGHNPVVGRIHKDRFLLDLRSVWPRQDELLVAAAEALDGGKSEPA